MRRTIFIYGSRALQNRNNWFGLPPYLDKNSALVLKIDMTTVSRNF